MGKHIFVCYARADKDFVLPLATKLKQEGLMIWLDQWDISPSEDWDLAIDDALESCAEFIIIMSSKAVRSHEVRGELRTALDDKKTILPILYKDCRVPRQLRLTQHVDFRGRKAQDKDGIQAILSVLKTQTTTKPGPPQSTTTSAGADLFFTPRLTRPSGLQGAPGVVGSTISATTVAAAQAEEPAFYTRWLWWVSLVVVVLAGVAGAVLADWLLNSFIGITTIGIPGQWWAFGVAGIIFGATYAALCAIGWDDSYIFYFVVVLLWAFGSSLLAWGLAAGGASIAAEVVPINPWLMCYAIFGALLLFVAGRLVNENSFEDWGHWLMAPLIIVLGFIALLLVDLLFGFGLDALQISLPDIPGKQLAYVLTAIAGGVAYLASDHPGGEIASVVVAVLGLAFAFAMAWGLALGAVYLAGRFFDIGSAVVAYVVFGFFMLGGLSVVSGWLDSL